MLLEILIFILYLFGMSIIPAILLTIAVSINSVAAKKILSNIAMLIAAIMGIVIIIVTIISTINCDDVHMFGGRINAGWYLATSIGSIIGGGLIIGTWAGYIYDSINEEEKKKANT
ncbi:MAG: hypothetical protein LBT48_05720 [Prevotellaceae bacterium]|jgi:Na+/H+-translocating membrane pyrophosphatase|nr:hypothetical protein [Prevotellaceae bacterium]